MSIEKDTNSTANPPSSQAAGYETPQDDPEYQKMVEELAKQCTCQPQHLRPCDGLMAGGLCDELDLRDPYESEES